MAFAHVRMMLYRPFVHYISRPKSKGSDERPYASAAACVDVSRKIVHTADDMRKKGVLNGAYWFTMYTTFFSVITLLYYVLENPTDVTSLAILSDAETGRDTLASLRDKSLAAKRCSMALLVCSLRYPRAGLFLHVIYIDISVATIRKTPGKYQTRPRESEFGKEETGQSRVKARHSRYR